MSFFHPSFTITPCASTVTLTTSSSISVSFQLCLKFSILAYLYVSGFISFMFCNSGCSDNCWVEYKWEHMVVNKLTLGQTHHGTFSSKTMIYVKNSIINGTMLLLNGSATRTTPQISKQMLMFKFLLIKLMWEIKIILIEVFHLVLRYSSFDSSGLILKVFDARLVCFINVT